MHTRMEFGGVVFNTTDPYKWTSEQHGVFNKVNDAISEKKRNLKFVLTVDKVRALIESLSLSSRSLVLQHIISILETYELRDTKILQPSGSNSYNSGTLLQWFKELTDFYNTPSADNNFSAKWTELYNNFSVNAVFNEVAKSILD